MYEKKVKGYIKEKLMKELKIEERKFHRIIDDFCSLYNEYIDIQDDNIIIDHFESFIKGFFVGKYNIYLNAEKIESLKNYKDLKNQK